MRVEIEKRLALCKLQLHPEKTHIVYCKDEDRRKEYPMITVDFLGYRFQPRMARNKHGKFFVSFLPAVSTKAKNKIRETIRGWRLHRMGRTSLKEVAEMINPVVRGWYQYCGRFYKTALLVVLAKRREKSHPLGAMEIQAPQKPSAQCATFSGSGPKTNAEFVCTLAAWARISG